MTMEVVAGTYSNLIYGHFVKPNEEQKLKFSTSFTNVAHSGIVKCMAVCKKGYLASGSTDEKIQIFKLKGKRIVLEPFREHDEPVVSLKFHKSSHLFSGSSDGRIIIWKTGSWKKLKVLKYKKPVLDFAVHPSGLTLLSTCKDRTLQLWDLTTGRRKYTINLKEEGEIIEFSQDGQYFIIVNGSKVDVYLTKVTEITYTIACSFQISCISFFDSKILLVGGSGGNLAFYLIKSGEKIHEMNTNTARVKSMSVCGSKVVIASSDGYLKLYDIAVKNSEITVTFITGIVRHQRWQCVSMIDLEDTESNVKRSGLVESKTDKQKKVDDNNEDDAEKEDTDDEESSSDDNEDCSDDEEEDDNGDSENGSGESESDDDEENGSDNSEDGGSGSDEEDEKMEE